jgi:hypothetical protein
MLQLQLLKCSIEVNIFFINQMTPQFVTDISENNFLLFILRFKIGLDLAIFI